MINEYTVPKTTFVYTMYSMPVLQVSIKSKYQKLGHNEVQVFSSSTILNVVFHTIDSDHIEYGSKVT